MIPNVTNNTLYIRRIGLMHHYSLLYLYFNEITKHDSKYLILTL